MVASSYRAFPSYATWNAWLRVWLVNKFFGDLRLFSSCMHYLESRDPTTFDQLLRDPLPLSQPPGTNEVDDLFRHAEALLKRVEACEIPAAAAAEEILGRFEDAECLPPVHAWSDPTANHLDYLPEKLIRTVQWGKTEAPAYLRDRLFAWNPAPLLGGGAPAVAEPDAEAEAAA